MLAGTDVAAPEVDPRGPEVAVMLERTTATHGTAKRLSYVRGTVEIGQGAAWDVTETVTERSDAVDRLETFGTVGWWHGPPTTA